MKKSWSVFVGLCVIRVFASMDTECIQNVEGGGTLLLRCVGPIVGNTLSFGNLHLSRKFLRI